MKNAFSILACMLIFSVILSACAGSQAATPSTASTAEVEATEISAQSESDADSASTGDAVTLRVGAKCGPSPHAMPFFMLMAQTEGVLPGGAQIEFVPVTDPSQMVALLNNGQVDVLLGFIAQTANIYQKGGVSNLRLLDVLLWKGFYVVSSEGVQSWEDLEGGKILMPNLQSGPSQLAMTAMRQAGFDPTADFSIEHLPASQIVQMMISGKADAAVVSEPFATIAMAKAASEGSVALKIAPIDMYSIYQAETWESGQAPINGLLALQETLDDPELSAALAELEAGYKEAVTFMEVNPDEAAKLIVSQLGTFCDSNMQVKPISKALQSGRMVYGVTPVQDLLPDLDAYIEEIVQMEIDDSFYSEYQIEE